MVNCFSPSLYEGYEAFTRKTNEPVFVGMPVIFPSRLKLSPVGRKPPERVHDATEGSDSSVAEYSLPVSAEASFVVIMFTEGSEVVSPLVFSPRGFTVRVSVISDEIESPIMARTLNDDVPALVGVPERSPEVFNVSP